MNFNECNDDDDDDDDERVKRKCILEKKIRKQSFMIRSTFLLPNQPTSPLLPPLAMAIIIIVIMVCICIYTNTFAIPSPERKVS